MWCDICKINVDRILTECRKNRMTIYVGFLPEYMTILLRLHSLFYLHIQLYTNSWAYFKYFACEFFYINDLYILSQKYQIHCTILVERINMLTCSRKYAGLSSQTEFSYREKTVLNFGIQTLLFGVYYFEILVDIFVYIIV